MAENEDQRGAQAQRARAEQARIRPSAFARQLAVAGHRDELAGGTQAVATRTAIMVYGCERDEADAFRRLAPGFGVAMDMTSEPLCEENAHLVAGRRCVSVGHKTPVSNGALRRLSRLGVAYLSTRSTGHNHIDAEFARSVGITVAGVAYSPDSVADYTLMLMLMALRNARSIVTRAEQHDFRLHPVRGRELRDATVGVIGTGRIGAAVIDRLQGFGCRVLAYDRNPKTSAQYVGLEELLRSSDIVTLHTPLTAETTHLVDRERIGLMRRDALIVNTGRGRLIDTPALLSALERGELGGAALDVVEGEDGIFYADRRSAPLENELVVRLQRLPNVLITPHTAYYTDRALRDTVENTIRNCLEFEGRQHG
jgi:D-specific alpha-keto acid dehydrogenase